MKYNPYRSRLGVFVVLFFLWAAELESSIPVLNIQGEFSPKENLIPSLKNRRDDEDRLYSILHLPYFDFDVSQQGKRPIKYQFSLS